MPQIIVTADGGAAFGDGAVTLRERVNVADFESQHFATQLVERLGWAVEDADQAEQVNSEEFSDRIPDKLPDANKPAATDERVTAPSPA